MNAQNATSTGSIEGISGKGYEINQAKKRAYGKAESKRYLNQELLEPKLKYWQTKLANYEIPGLPLDKPRLKRTVFTSNMLHVELDVNTSTKLRELALQLNVSIDAILLSAYYLLVRSYANQDDIIVSTPIINLNQSVAQNVDALDEFFLHNLVLRSHINPDMELNQFIIQINEEITNSRANCDIPYQLFAQRLNIAPDVIDNPFSRLIFVVQDFTAADIDFAQEPGSEMQNLVEQISRADLAFVFDNINCTNLSGMLNYASDLFNIDTITGFIKTYKLILSQFSYVIPAQGQGCPGIHKDKYKSDLPSLPKICDICYLDAEDYEKVVFEWNATDKDYPHNQTIHQIFEEQVKETPDNIAVVYEDTKLTYKELNRRSNQLAHYLLDNYQIKPDDLIALCLERSEHMLIAILAVLKSGAAYVPIDPSYPEARIQYMLIDTNAKVLLTNLSFSDSTSKSTTFCHSVLDTESSLRILPIDDKAFNQQLKQQKSTNPKTEVTSRNLAYVIYTSGTTGKPKGVMVEHRGVVNRVIWMNDIHKLTEEDQILQRTPYVFDVSAWEMFWPIWYGTSTVIVKQCEYKDPNYIIDAIDQNKVSIVHFVPSMLNAFIDNVEFRLNGTKIKLLSSLKYIFCSGESLSLSQIKRVHKILPSVQIYNLYGPTEASIDTLYFDCTQKSIKSVYIGKPIYNTKAYVLSNDLVILPIGAVGELYVGGDGVVRGYLNQAELTKEKFIANPFQTIDEENQGENFILYKTGDLVRFMPDGNLEYIGRNDSQIKIRGYRIELGEIETTLNQYPNIKQSLVLAAENKDSVGNLIGDKYLVAYYVAKTKLDEKSIYHYLSTQLTDYMLPTALVHLQQLPSTINGKLDRMVLPQVELTNSATYVTPLNNIETRLCEIYAETLNLPVSQIGIKHSFLQLGGNSISAISAVAKINASIVELKDKIKITDILNNNIESIYAAMNDISICDENISNKLIAMQKVINNMPITSMQKTILTHEFTSCNHLIYNEHVLIENLTKINYEKFLQGCQVLLNQYLILSSNYKLADTVNEFIGFMLHDETGLIIKEINVAKKSDRNKVLVKLLKQPFRLDKDRLIRFYLMQYAKSSEIIIIFHHVILDASSVINILIPNLLNIIQGKKTFIFANASSSNAILDDYTLFQHKLNNYYQKQLNTPAVVNYWQTKLEQADDLRFTNVVGHANCAHDLTGKLKNFIIDPIITTELKQLAKQNNFSLFSVLYSAFSIVIGKYSRNEHVCIRTNIDERCLYSEHLNTLGCFINNGFISSTLNNDLNLIEYVLSVQQSLHDSINNLLSYDELLKLNRDKVLQLAKIHFNLRPNALNTKHQYEQKVTEINSGNIKSELFFELDVQQNTIYARVEYANNIYSDWLIDSLITSYINLLKQFATDMNTKLSKVSLLSLEQYQQIVVDWNKTDKDYPEHKTIHQLFEEQVEKTPENIAVVYEDTKLTYKELNKGANQLAHYLLDNCQVKPDDLIALCLERSEHVLIAILAVLKSGAAYVPIDPSHPEARIQYMLTDTNAKVLLTNEALNMSFLRGDTRVQEFISINILPIDNKSFDQQLKQQKSINPKTDVTSGNLAYVIYTSGTTGKPKGVMVEHRSVVNYLQNIAETFFMNSQQLIVDYSTNIAFDLSVSTTLGTLCSGHQVSIYKGDLRNIDLYTKHLISNKINLIKHVPSYFELAVDFLNKTNVSRIMLGGEKLNPSILNKLNQDILIYDEYGPTEATVGTTYMMAQIKDLMDNQYFSIGKPYFNYKIYVSDSNLNILPIGAVGELYIGGECLARGYVNLTELTAGSFIENLFQTENDKKQCRNTKLYKTGDLVRLLPDGNLEYIGRTDSQLKIRGCRVEVDEIANILNQYPGIKQSVVTSLHYKENSDKAVTNKYLVGYYTANNKLNDKEILNYLGRYVPNYMLPRKLIHLDQLPLTAVTGKLDKSTLPDSEFTRENHYLRPQNELQLIICKIFANTLEMSPDIISINDDFFKLGGNSFLAIKLIHEINRELNANLGTSVIFEYKNIASLAASIDYDIRLEESYGVA